MVNLHDSESYKSLFEHSKQFWTLPGSGIAVGAVLLGTSFKELPALVAGFSPKYFLITRIACILLFGTVVLAMTYFIRSIRLCVNSQYSLILLVSESEGLDEGDSETAKKEARENPRTTNKPDNDLRTRLNESVVRLLRKGKRCFNRGALMLIVSAVLLSGAFICTFFGLFREPADQKVEVRVARLILHGNAGTDELRNVTLTVPVFDASSRRTDLAEMTIDVGDAR